MTPHQGSVARSNDDLLAAVEHALYNRCSVAGAKELLVAVSGGLDSVVLLDILHVLAQKHMHRLEVAHADHQLRPESVSDAQFVRELAAQRGLQFHLGQLDVKSRAAQAGLSLEMAARELRYQFLAQTALRGRIRIIALGHHADDQLELFFLRLFRGTSGEGIAGMRWRAPCPEEHQVTLVRPFLECRKNQLLEYAASKGLPYKEDSTNSDSRFQRNRIRRELLPLLRDRFGFADAPVLRLMELSGAEAEFVTQVAQDWLTKGPKGQNSPLFGELPLALQRKVVCLQLLSLGIEPEFELIERLRGLEGVKITAPGGRMLSRDHSGLLRENSESLDFILEEARVFTGERGECVFAERKFEWLLRPGDGGFSPVQGGEVFDADLVGVEVTLRHWRAGDRFQPSGMPRPVRLQDLWVNQGVSARDRRQRVVAATSSGELFWVEGLRISERHKVTAGTKRELVWRWGNSPVTHRKP